MAWVDGIIHLMLILITFADAKHRTTEPFLIRTILLIELTTNPLLASSDLLVAGLCFGLSDIVV